MPLIFEVAKWLHVAAGVLSLLAGPLAMAAHKGGRLHRAAGRTYYWGMATIFVTAMVMSLFRANIFLISVSVLSFYAAFSGYRTLAHKRAGSVPGGALDRAGALVALAVGLAVAAWGLALAVAGELGRSPFPALGIVFGLLIILDARSDLSRFRRPAEKNAWWFLHMNRMLGSFVGLVTAFLVQTVAPRLLDAGMPPGWIWVVWVAPAIIGTPAIAAWVATYRRRFAGEPGASGLPRLRRRES